MSDDLKYAVLDAHESVAESIYKDFVTAVMVSFCVYISQGSTWWTFITGSMFLIFVFAKVSAALKRVDKFKTKSELQAWVDELPDDKEPT